MLAGVGNLGRHLLPTRDISDAVGGFSRRALRPLHYLVASFSHQLVLFFRLRKRTSDRCTHEHGPRCDRQWIVVQHPLQPVRAFLIERSGEPQLPEPSNASSRSAAKVPLARPLS